MPRTEDQFKDMREKSKRLIIDTAMELFSTEGYHSTSISRISKKAGIATGLVYNYFKSKEDLLEVIIRNSMDEFNSLILAESKIRIESNDLAGLIDALFETLKLKINSWRLFIRIFLQPEVSEISRKVGVDFSSLLGEFSVNYFAKKGLTDPQKQSRILGILLHAAILAFIINDDKEELELMKNEIIQKYL